MKVENKLTREKEIAFVVKKALEFGAKEAKVIEASTIATAPWVRLKCRFGCGGYGTSLMCPPHTPTPAEMRKVIDSYDRAVLFEIGKDSESELEYKLEREAFLAGYHKALGLGGGPCMLCEEECAFDEGCRHAKSARPSMEGCGIDVYQTVRTNGFEINVARDREAPVHFFGVVLVE